MVKVETFTVESLGFKHFHVCSLKFTRLGIYFLRDIKFSRIQKIYSASKTVLKRIKVAVWKAVASEIVIISGIRDPFSRCISAFILPAHYLKFDVSIAKPHEVYEKHLLHRNLKGTTLWFDEEISKVFAIDVYSKKFNMVDGYQIFEFGKIKLFLYRVDKMNLLEDQLADFLGMPHLSLKCENFTKNDDDGGYTFLKSKVKFDAIEIEEILKTKYMIHFFSEEERSKLKSKWIQK